MKSLPEGERPYEKCLHFGASALSDQELLAIILRSGTTKRNSLDLAQDVLARTRLTPYPGLSGLSHLSVADLMEMEGIGQVKAVQLKCIGELAKRISLGDAKAKLVLSDPGSIAHYYMEKLRHEEQEVLMGLMLGVKNQMMGDVVLSKGTVSLSVMPAREIFVEALRLHAVSLILVHNHPSGDPEPSPEDIESTRKLIEGGRLLGIRVLDHIVVGSRSYVSLRSRYAQIFE